MTGVETAIERVRQAYGGWRRDTTVEKMRADWDALFRDAAMGAPPLVPVDAGGCPAAWVDAAGCDQNRVLLYLHGGGFRVGSTRSHHRLMADLSSAAGVRVLGLDYDLCPEAIFPVAIDQTIAAWNWLHGQGYQSSHIAIGGDSAGANVALAAMLRLRDMERSLPKAAILLSAWTDLTASGSSFDTRSEADPIHTRAMIRATAGHYLGDIHDPVDPSVSPLFAMLASLPPMLLQVGDRETVLSDTTDFADRAREAGVSATASVWPGMIHVFQQFPDLLPEAQSAIAECGEFLKLHFSKDPS